MLTSQVRRTRSFQDIRASIGSRQQAVGKAGNSSGSGGRGARSHCRSGYLRARRRGARESPVQGSDKIQIAALFTAQAGQITDARIRTDGPCCVCSSACISLTLTKITGSTEALHSLTRLDVLAEAPAGSSTSSPPGSRSASRPGSGGKPGDAAAHAAVTARSRRSHDQRVLKTVSAPHSEKKMAAVAEETATSPRPVRLPRPSLLDITAPPTLQEPPNNSG